MAARVRVLSGWSIGTESHFARAGGLYRSGMTVAEIARRLGYDARTIHRWLKRMPYLPRRGAGWNNQGKPIRHGTISGYARCRRRPEGSCTQCRAANAHKQRTYRVVHAERLNAQQRARWAADPERHRRYKQEWARRKRAERVTIPD